MQFFKLYSGYSAIGLIVRGYLYPMLPGALRAPVFELRKWVVRFADNLKAGERRPKFLFRRRSRTRSFLSAPGLGSRIARMSYEAVTSGGFLAYMKFYDSVADFAGVEWRMPYLDRRLIDYVLTLPPRVRFNSGQRKYILRKAMAGILPDKVRDRRGWAEFSQLYHRGIRGAERDKVDQLVSDSRASQRDLVSPRLARQAWGSYLKIQGDYHAIEVLLAFLRTEIWLRHIELLDSSGHWRSPDHG
jgi:asparagine synthase (glutamine-hydrolysing)